MESMTAHRHDGGAGLVLRKLQLAQPAARAAGTGRNTSSDGDWHVPAERLQRRTAAPAVRDVASLRVAARVVT